MENKNRQNKLFDVAFVICLAFVFIYFIEYPILHDVSLNRLVWIPGLLMVLISCLAYKIDTKLDIRWFVAFFTLISIIIVGILATDKLTSFSHWFAGFAFILTMVSMRLFSMSNTSKLLFDFIYVFAVLLAVVFIIYCFTPIVNTAYFKGVMRRCDYYVFNLDNSNIAGMYLFGIFSILIINISVRKYRLLNIALCCAVFYMLFRTNSRACIVAAIIVAAAAILPKKSLVPKTLIVIAWLFPILFGSLYLFVYESGFENVEILGKSLFSGRQEVFVAYLAKIKNGWHFLFGNYASASLQNAHNAPLTFYSSLGIVGAVITEIMLLINAFRINLGSKISFMSLFAVLGLFIQSSAEAGMFLGGFPGIIFLLIFFLLANYQDYDLLQERNKRANKL